jgi:lysophospholipase L1-like esterase
MVADKVNYLADICDSLALKWPDNPIMHIVCHGHSVPAGYFATPYIDTFHSYPHLFHYTLKERYPFAVINVIVTAIGGEHSRQGAARFTDDVLCHKPGIITIDYGLNDRLIGIGGAEKAWRSMIEKALAEKIKVILLTPSWDQSYFAQNDDWKQLTAHAEQIRGLASEYAVGLADTFLEFQRFIDRGGHLNDLLSHIVHPGYAGHKIISGALAQWFTAR